MGKGERPGARWDDRTVKQILVVDDQAAVRELIETTLRIGPYHILQAATGPEALELAQRERPHLILLDVKMGGNSMDGLEVCRRLKAGERTRDSLVIMVSARGQAWEVEEGYAAGAHGYIVKPFSPLELMKKVHQFISD